MSTRISRRLVGLAVLLFFGVGLFIVAQRPRQHENTMIHQVHDLVLAEAHLSPCTAINPMNGFIDLRGLMSTRSDGKFVPWHAKSHDTGHNFTIGVCSGALKKSQWDAPFVDSVNALRVGAYYVENGKHILMGELEQRPQFLGHKLTLTYGNGLVCGMTYKNGDPVRRKTILTFTCDREMLTRAHISYLGSLDECTYMFEVRSHYACPTAAQADNLAAVWIFFFISLAALLVYLLGGILYRTLRKSH